MALVDRSVVDERNKLIREAAAAEELLKRTRARTNMTSYSTYVEPIELPAKHHRLICDALDDVIEGRNRRLMLFMPPGVAKSTYTSVRFAPYFLGKDPQKSIICASYGEGLATSFGRKVRNALLSKEYQNVFPGVTLSEDSRAKGEWETNKGGSYFAAGVGSAITGRRADLGLIDDPVKSRKEADSELARNETWQWYLSDFFSRLKPNAAQIIIQTRWHEDDLSGRILPESWNGESGDFEGFDGQIWRVICLPAQARENDVLGREVGEWLWPDYFTPDVWEEIKSVQTSKDVRNWNSLYQQIPQPDSGVFFQREWFKRFRIGDEPRALSKYGASDYAVSDNGGDFTEHGVGGFDEHDDLYFVDWWSGQKTMDVWIKEQMILVKRHDPFAWIAEVGTIRRSAEPWVKKEKQKHWFRTEWMPHIGDKAANARSFQALAAQGRVYIPNCEWGEELINQLVKFIPNTNFKDDKVDVCGLFGRILDQAYAPSILQIETKKETDSYDENEEEPTWKLN